jgi:hypothetical protein
MKTPSMVTASTPVREARIEPRVPVVLAVELSSKAKPGRCGVTRNASGKGLLIVTPSRFSVGDELDVAVHLGSHSGRTSARVVRVEENARDSVEVWRYRLAVELHGALSDELLSEARIRAS